MNRNSHQQQSGLVQINKTNLIANGRYLHDQAIGTAIMKVLPSSRRAGKHQPKTWQRPQQMKCS